MPVTTSTPTCLNGDGCSGTASGADTGGRNTFRGGVETTAEPQGLCHKAEEWKSLLTFTPLLLAL